MSITMQSDPSKEALLARLTGGGQEHVLAFYDELTAEQRAKLAHQILSVPDYAHLNDILRDSLAALNDATAPVPVNEAVHMQGEAYTNHIMPPPASAIVDMHALSQSHEASTLTVDAVRRAGYEVLSRGEGAVVLLAGGSGTRLGVTVPKGLFTCPILREQKSLFQMHAERLLRMQELTREAVARAVPPIPLFVMTSEQNDDATRAFFAEHAYFGLQPGQVCFFVQGSLPCFDAATGKILMASPCEMCMAPAGNGDIYRSLTQPSITGEGSTSTMDTPLRRMCERGVRWVQICNVDNLLLRLADPLFFGCAALSRAHVVVKAVRKASAQEAVGVFACIADAKASGAAGCGGRFGVVEYTEIGPARASERDVRTGALRYNCANIGCQLCSVDFLQRAAKEMQRTTHYHAARKTITTMHGKSASVKLEAFIFDMFGYCNDIATTAISAASDGDEVVTATADVNTRGVATGVKAHDTHGVGEDKTEGATRCSGAYDDGFRILLVERGEEFAPIKNADGAASDTPTTAAQMLLALHSSWAERLLASHDMLTQEQAEALRLLRSGARRVEVSPLVSYGGEGLAAREADMVHDLVHGPHDIVLIAECT